MKNSSVAFAAENITSFGRLLTDCWPRILEHDAQYGLCLMNSGFFSIPKSISRVSIADLKAELGPLMPQRANLLRELSLSKEAVAQQLLQRHESDTFAYGSCRLHCTNPGVAFSRSCCESAKSVRNCRTKIPLLKSCRKMIENVFAKTQYCEFSTSAIVLLVMTLSSIAFFLFVYMQSRKHYIFAMSRRQSCVCRYALRIVRPHTERWNIFLSDYRQITNQVWKNITLRRRHPVKLFTDLMLPIVLVAVLVLMANVDTWFSNVATPTIIAKSAAKVDDSSDIIVCTDLIPIEQSSSVMGILTATQMPFYSIGQSILGFYLLLSFVSFVSATTAFMVIEKESRIRDHMKIAGLSEKTLLISWVLTCMIFSTPLSFVVAAELKFGGVFLYADITTLVFLFWSLNMSITAFSYCLTPFFNRSRTASIASVLLWISLFFPYMSVQLSSNSKKYLAAFLPPTAFSLGIDSLIQYAQRGRGITNAASRLEIKVNVPSALAMSCFLLLDSIILIALGFYFEMLIPRNFGNFSIRKLLGRISSCFHGATKENVSSECIIISPSADLSSPHFGGSYHSVTKSMQKLQSNSKCVPPMSGGKSSSLIEPMGYTFLRMQELSGTYLQISGLRKEYPLKDGNVHVAVKNFNFTMYCNQITVLLGHNGAGKTTTISMLTGLIQPTTGCISMSKGNKDTRCIRRSLGICAQHDVLFEDLTVAEHLRLFGTMKNIHGRRLDEEVDRLISDVGLITKCNVRSKCLSGGQKRMLSMALAFIGGSKLIFLDEPTSGMDPRSRRFAWDLLRRNRKDRIIIMTTHFMDEADILGDRIVILADGEIRCAGSSMFLKKRLGSGYNLRILTKLGCRTTCLLQFVQHYVEQISTLSNYGSEIVFQLPNSSSADISKLLNAIESHKCALGIEQYGISMATLEEVFLRIISEKDHTRITSTSSGFSLEHPSVSAATSSIRNYNLAPDSKTQFFALLTKRARVTRRDWKNLFTLVGIPIILMLIQVLCIPEIDISQYTATTSYAPKSKMTIAETANLSCMTNVSNDYWQSLGICERMFRYCPLGVIDCSASACCDFNSTISPYYACNTCEKRETPCYNSKCMSRLEASMQSTLNAFIISLMTVLAFTFIPAAIVSFLTREKDVTQNAKALQIVAGVDIKMYWWSNLVHDVLLTLLPATAGIVLIPLSIRTLNAPIEVLGLACLVLSHIAVCIPMAYIFSLKFQQPAQAQISLIVFMMCTGCLLSTLSFLCRLMSFADLSILDRSYFRWIYLLFPGYGLNIGVYEIATRKVNRNIITNRRRPASLTSFFGILGGFGTDANCVPCWVRNAEGCCYRGVFDLDTSGASIIYACLESIIFMLIVFEIERRNAMTSVTRCGAFMSEERRVEDDDVAREREVVSRQAASSANNVILIRNLRKEYREKKFLACQEQPGHVALNDLCLSIPRGECFGYLGVNGAGKSSTTKLLTGQMAPTTGFIYLNGYDVSNAAELQKARSMIGYCPQFDALHDLLTVREQLELYAQMKGIPHELLYPALEQSLDDFNLQEVRDQLTCELSGGMKRKVSTAIAMLGSPPIILLDEPSTGMDPFSRRKMRDAIMKARLNKNICVLLTTHSMEECEALCTRIGILVHGELKCLGSTQHLKSKFGNGVTLTVKLSEPSEEAIEEIRAQIETCMAMQSDFVTKDNLYTICKNFGALERYELIAHRQGSAWLLSIESGIPIDLFAAWWLLESRCSNLKEFLQQRFRNCKLIEQQERHLKYTFAMDASTSLCKIFALLEENKNMFMIDEFGINDTSLEQIFIDIAAEETSLT